MGGKRSLGKERERRYRITVTHAHTDSLLSCLVVTEINLGKESLHESSESVCACVTVILYLLSLSFPRDLFPPTYSLLSSTPFLSVFLHPF